MAFIFTRLKNVIELYEKMQELLSRQRYLQISSRNEKILPTSAVCRVLIANCSSGIQACMVEVLDTYLCSRKQCIPIQK